MPCVHGLCLPSCSFTLACQAFLGNENNFIVSTTWRFNLYQGGGLLETDQENCDGMGSVGGALDCVSYDRHEYCTFSLE